MGDYWRLDSGSQGGTMGSSEARAFAVKDNHWLA